MFEIFFARKIAFQNHRSVSVLMVRLAVLSVAVAVATLCITHSLQVGFEGVIQDKLVGLLGHYRVGNYFLSDNPEVQALPRYNQEIMALQDNPSIRSITPIVEQVGFVSKPNLEDIWLKGVDTAYNWSFFQSYLQEGTVLDLHPDQISTGILISSELAKSMGKRVGEKLEMYFWSNSGSMRKRVFTVNGIFDTHIEEFDKKQAFCDMRVLQKIWGWDENSVSSFEIRAQANTDLQRLSEEINLALPIDYQAIPITELYPEIFSWLGLLRQNVDIIYVLMVIVAVVNMATVLLIMILERTRTIGVLQTLGLAPHRIIGIFVMNAGILILAGVLIGNVVGLGLLAIQDTWGWFTLDEKNYYTDKVPVAWVWDKFLGVNVYIIGVCTVLMIIPALIVTRIKPIQAIQTL